MPIITERWIELDDIPLAEPPEDTDLSGKIPQALHARVGLDSLAPSRLSDEQRYVIQQDALRSVRALTVLDTLLRTADEPLLVAELGVAADGQVHAQYGQTIVGKGLVSYLTETDAMQVFGTGIGNPRSFAFSLEPPGSLDQAVNDSYGMAAIKRRYAGIEVDFEDPEADFELAFKQSRERPEIGDISLSSQPPYSTPSVIHEDTNGDVVATEAILPVSPRILVLGDTALWAVLEELRFE